jgi:cell division protein FtsI/penicillin-binding protein 2
LASYPDYDLNELQKNFESISGRDEEAPLMNRATQSQLEPGSTIKPLVGLAAISDAKLSVPGIGQLTARTGIECTGYLVLNGRKLQNGRCWTATKYARQLGEAGVAHHPIPHPHKGSYGNPDGYLHFADALERSCNVYFETCADALGIMGLSNWFEKFGLGRESGIGIAEARGYLPNRISSPLPSHAWFSGIGQTGVLTTPLQMANVAATIARGGTWVRPRLIENADELKLPPVTDRFGKVVPDQADLGLSAEALAACRDGMIRVVNSPDGTGDKARMSGILVAGKTGTAEAKEKFDEVLDDEGKPIVDQKGRKLVVPWPRSIGRTVGKYPWYRGAGENGTQLNHAWFIGFAPANDPQVAFAIMIEYGGSGNFAAKHAPKVVEKCIEHGYIKVTKN